MRRLLVLVTCVALAVVGCVQDDSATSADDPEVTTTAVADAALATDEPTTIAPATTSTAVESSSSETTATTAAPSTTTKAPATTTTVDEAAEAAEAFAAFNASVATVVGLSKDLSDEIDALEASIRAHRADLIKGDSAEICCSAHIEFIKGYQADITAEIVTAQHMLDPLGPAHASFADPLGPAHASLVESLTTMAADMDNLGSIWTGIGIGIGGGGIADIEAALDGLDECEAAAMAIVNLGEICCNIRADF